MTATQSAPVPNSAVMNAGVTAVTLIDCMAATPSRGRSSASAGMTKLEKAKNTPPFSPQPTAAAIVSAVTSPSIGSGRAHRRVPHARRGGPAYVLGEVPGLAPEGLLHAVGEAGVAPVEDLAVQVGEQVDLLLRHAQSGRLGGVLLH